MISFFIQLWTVIKFIGALLFSVVYMVEGLLLLFVPRSFRRHDVTGKIVLITGAGSGLGRLVALRLAGRGATIVSWDVNAKGNEETQRMVEEAGGRCFCFTVDICDRKIVYKVAEQVKKNVGMVDILVNNAGIVTGRNFLESPDELIQKTFDVNIISHFWMVKAFVPDMIAANSGHIVSIASLAGFFGSNKLADYCASKFAAVGFDESLRMELWVEGHTGVNTTVVCPYYVNTGMFHGVKSKLLPILKQDFVADEITDAILMKTKQLVLPSYCNVFIAMKTLLPINSQYIIGSTSGATVAMDAYVGRGKIK